MRAPWLSFMTHEKCDIANFTLVFAFEQNNDDKRSQTHFSFLCFRNVAFDTARCINMHAMKNNENDAAFIQLDDPSLNTFF